MGVFVVVVGPRVVEKLGWGGDAWMGRAGRVARKMGGGLSTGVSVGWERGEGGVGRERGKGRTLVERAQSAHVF